jgi:hypothetical protein
MSSSAYVNSFFCETLGAIAIARPVAKVFPKKEMWDT